MYLVQMLLPLRDNEGRPFPAAPYAQLRAELVDRFGGVTCWQRAPASGLWEDEEGRQRDDLVLFEVMVESLDRDWWRACKARLERALRQDQLLVRVLPCEWL